MVVSMLESVGCLGGAWAGNRRLRAVQPMAARHGRTSPRASCRDHRRLNTHAQPRKSAHLHCSTTDHYEALQGAVPFTRPASMEGGVDDEEPRGTHDAPRDATQGGETGPGVGDDNKFQTAIGAWRNIDLTSLIPQLDSVASDIVAHQRDTLTQRKDLAQKTKDFRKLDDASKLNDFKALLKCTQTNVQASQANANIDI
jgi:hypothetical protein